jgi:hypothetical protein
MKNSHAPGHLEVPERDLFETIRREFAIIDAAGLSLLLSACESSARARRCREIIDREGESVAGKPHHLLMAERDAKKLFISTVRALNLDLSSAGDVGRPAGTTVRRVS